MQQHNVHWVCIERKRTSQSCGGWFLRLALHNHVFVSFVVVFCLRNEGAVRDNTLYNDVNLFAWLRMPFKQAHACGVVCVWYVCGNEIPDLKKKHLSRHPFSSMSETLYRNCTILLLSICTHLHTYVHTYTHMHWTTVFFFEGEHN